MKLVRNLNKLRTRLVRKLVKLKMKHQRKPNHSQAKLKMPPMKLARNLTKLRIKLKSKLKRVPKDFHKPIVISAKKSAKRPTMLNKTLRSNSNHMVKVVTLRPTKQSRHTRTQNNESIIFAFKSMI